MKKNKLITYTSMLALALFLNTIGVKKVHAFVYADFINIVQGAVEDVGEALKTVGDVRKKAQAFLASLKIGGKKDFPEAQLGEVASVNSVEQNLDCANITIDGTKSKQEYEEAIYGLMDELFFTSPYCKSDLDFRDKNMKYELEAKKFYEDTLVEAVTAALNVEKEIEKIKGEIGLFENEISGADSTSEIDTAYYNLKANVLYDEALKLFEELLAIKSQFTAAKIIEETSANEKEDCPKEDAALSLKYQSQQPQYFAKLQLAPAKPKKEEQKVNRLEFKEEFAKFEAIEKLGLEAIDLHYNINKMRDYKSLYKRRSELEERKQEIIQISKTVEICTKGLFESGGMAKVDKRWLDISARAKNTFELMKAKMMDSDDEEMEEKPGVENFDTDIESAQPSEAQIEEEQKYNDESSSGTTLGEKMANFKEIFKGRSKKNKNKTAAQDDSARDIGVMAWRIGSQVAQNLEEEGELKFPIWHDVKNFYNLYLDKKYDAVKTILKGNMDSSLKSMLAQVEKELVGLPAEEIEEAQKKVETEFEGFADDLGLKLDAGKIIAFAKIDQLVKAIKAKNSSYTPQGASKVARLHKETMDAIKALQGISLTISVEDKTVEIIKTAAEIVFGEAQNVDEQEAEHYFVGIDDRVLKAPKAAPNNTRLPLREVIHLDDTDWADWKSLKQGTSFAAFKTYYENEYGNLPEVWQLMTAEKVFVTAIDAQGNIEGENFPLESFVGITNDQVEALSPEFVWGGIYPCWVTEKSLLIGLDVEENIKKIKAKYATVSDASYYTDYPQKVCAFNTLTTDDKITDSRCVVRKSLFNSEKCKGEKLKDPQSHKITSELGSLFTLNQDKGLSLIAQVDRLLELIYEKNQNEEAEDPTYEDNVSQDMLFNKNQVGAYLEAYDARVDIENQLAELEKQILEAEKNIAELLQKVGYSVSEGVNLADEKVYESINNKLMSAKNKKIGQFRDSMSSVKVKGQKALERKLLTHEALLTALNMDKTCLLNIDYNSIPINQETGEINITELQSELKTKQADRNTVDTYEKDAADGAGIDIKPYCGVYRIK